MGLILAVNPFYLRTLNRFSIADNHFLVRPAAFTVGPFYGPSVSLFWSGSFTFWMLAFDLWMPVLPPCSNLPIAFEPNIAI